MGTKRFPVNGIFMELLVSFGGRLREERERLLLNQTAFAAVGGVTKKTQMLYEAGERFPDVRYLAAVQQIGCESRYVITGLREALPAETLTADEQELLTLFRAAPLAVKAAAVAGLAAGGASASKETVKQVNVTASGAGSQAAGRNIVNKR